MKKRIFVPKWFNFKNRSAQPLNFEADR